MHFAASKCQFCLYQQESDLILPLAWKYSSSYLARLPIAQIIPERSLSTFEDSHFLLKSAKSTVSSAKLSASTFLLDAVLHQTVRSPKTPEVVTDQSAVRQLAALTQGQNNFTFAEPNNRFGKTNVPTSPLLVWAKQQIWSFFSQKDSWSVPEFIFSV